MLPLALDIAAAYPVAALVVMTVILAFAPVAISRWRLAGWELSARDFVFLGIAAVALTGATVHYVLSFREVDRFYHYWEAWMSEPYYPGGTITAPPSAEEVARYEASIDYTPLSFVLPWLATITVVPALVLSFPVRWAARWYWGRYRRDPPLSDT